MKTCRADSHSLGEQGINMTLLELRVKPERRLVVEPRKDKRTNERQKVCELGHCRVSVCLVIKARPSAKKIMSHFRVALNLITKARLSTTFF